MSTDDLEVIELDATELLVVEVDEPPDVADVFIAAGVAGAAFLDELGDVDGAAAGATGAALVKEPDGQWRPSPTLTEASFDATKTLAEAHDIRLDTLEDSDDEQDDRLDALEASRGYFHQQVAAVEVWTVPHSLGYRPNVTAKDSTDSIIEPADITHAPDLLSTALYFTGRPVSGTAVAS